MGGNTPIDSLDDCVVDFYSNLFGKIFSEPFRAQITSRLKGNAVVRQVEESADAASQSLIRLFQNQRVVFVVTGECGPYR